MIRGQPLSGKPSLAGSPSHSIVYCQLADIRKLVEHRERGHPDYEKDSRLSKANNAIILERFLTGKEAETMILLIEDIDH